MGDTNAGGESETSRKIFLGGLSSRTEESSLRSHFDSYGEIVDCCVIMTSGPDRERRSRGFGFVTFASSTSVDQVMEARSDGKISVDDKDVEVKQAVPRESENPAEKIKKMFIGGIGSLTEDQLSEFFGKYGTIEETIVPVDRTTSKNKGFAFIIYESYETTNKVVAMTNHEVKGVTVECKRAKPSGDSARGGGRGGRGGGYGGQRNDYNSYGGGYQRGGGDSYYGGGGGGGGYGGGGYEGGFGGGYGGGGGYEAGGYGGGYGGGANYESGYAAQSSNYGPTRGGSGRYSSGGSAPYSGGYGGGYVGGNKRY